MTITQPTSRTLTSTSTEAPSISEDVRIEQLEMLCTQAHAGTATFLANSAIMCAVLWQVVPHERLAVWYALVLLVGAARVALVPTFQRQPRSERAHWRWLASVLSLSMASGALWGLGGALFVPADSVMHQAFVAILLAGMAAGAVPMLSAVWEVYVVYAIPTLLPFAMWLVWHGGDMQRYAGMLFGIFLVMMLFVSRRHFVMTSETLRLRFENERLQQSLHDANVNAEVAAEELRAEMADRRKAQAALWQSEARFQKLIDQAADAFLLLDQEGRICEVNQQACDSLGYSYLELVSASVRDLYPELDEATVDRAWEQLVSGQSLTLELVSRRRDRSTFPVEARLSLFDTGEERFVLALVRDVSERKKVERLKNEFVSTVSHELRTPLTCIHASLAVLKAEHLEPLPPASKEMVEIAFKNGEQLIRLINDLLDVQKIESEMMEFRFEAVTMQSLVEEAVATSSILAEREGVRLAIAEADAGAVVWADAGRLTQVIGNLLSNAIKYSPLGEAVELAIRRTEGAVRVEVRDRGPGIPEEFRDKVFQKFTQADASNVRQKGGTGLGLSICQMILERMSGRIGFESEVGRGSTFWFELGEFRG